MSRNHIPVPTGVACGSQSFVAQATARSEGCGKCSRRVEHALRLALAVVRGRTEEDPRALKAFEAITDLLGDP